jgi:hypothetical protein
MRGVGQSVEVLWAVRCKSQVREEMSLLGFQIHRQKRVAGLSVGNG